MTLTPLPAHVDLPALERDVLEKWRDRKVFERSVEQTRSGPPWIFYEGPPTANGKPGVHHVEARVFKDVFPRLKTMQGYHVPRKGGWDCHGLPVEIAVEQELGFTGKKDIERYGIAEFNARCRESVLRHVDEFGRMTERMGYWLDTADAYWTMDSSYVQSVWWSLKQVWEKGLLVEDHRVAPYCPRCGTGLSDHEVAQGYETVVDPSVYVRFPATSGPAAEHGADFLVWTTTPWTLVSNTAVAVHPDGPVRGGPQSTGDVRAGGAAAGQGLRRRRGGGARPLPGHGAGALGVPEAVRARGHPRRALRDPGRLRDDGGRHRPGAPGPRVRRGGPRREPRVRAAGGQPDPPGRHLLRRGPARRRGVLQGGRRARWSPTCASAGCCSASSRTSTRTRTAGAATPRCSTTPCRPGTSGPPRSRTSCWPRTSGPTGTRRPSSTAGTATG